MYKVKKGLAPSYVADLFTVTNSQYHLRNSDFVIPRFRTVTYGKHSLTYLGPVIWSNLTNLFDRLNHWTFLKSALKRLISKLCWIIFVKTAFYVTKIVV